MERDEKGRFKKGNKEGRKFTSSDGRAADIGKKGGIVSAENKKATLYAEKYFLGDIERDDGTLTNGLEISVIQQAKKAMKGDNKSMELMLKLINQFPTEKHDVNVTSPQGVTIICENKEQEDILKRLEQRCKD